MSFVVVYNIAESSAIPHHSLTRIIGSDGLVYSLCKDVAIVLGHSSTCGRRLSNIKVRDVTGPLDNVLIFICENPFNIQMLKKIHHKLSSFDIFYIFLFSILIFNDTLKALYSETTNCQFISK